MTLPPHPLLADCTALPPETSAQMDGQTEASLEHGFPCIPLRQHGHPVITQAALLPLDRCRLLQMEGPKQRVSKRDLNFWESPQGL